MKAYPNGQCYCGCGTALSDRTSFWVRGHDALAAHRVIRERYGTVADFVVAHDADRPGLREKVAQLEALVFPLGRDAGAGVQLARTEAQREEMGRLTNEIEGMGVPVDCPGAMAVVHLANALLAEYEKMALR
jgi:hypothetical protein